MYETCTKSYKLLTKSCFSLSRLHPKPNIPNSYISVELPILFLPEFLLPEELSDELRSCIDVSLNLSCSKIIHLLRSQSSTQLQFGSVNWGLNWHNCLIKRAIQAHSAPNWLCDLISQPFQRFICSLTYDTRKPHSMKMIDLEGLQKPLLAAFQEQRYPKMTHQSQRVIRKNRDWIRKRFEILCHCSTQLAGEEIESEWTNHRFNE